MDKSFDGLIGYLIDHVAISGHCGVTPDELVSLIHSYYSDDATNGSHEIVDNAGQFTTKKYTDTGPKLDSLLFEYVWNWLANDPDIRLADSVQARDCTYIEAQASYRLGPPANESEIVVPEIEEPAVHSSLTRADHEIVNRSPSTPYAVAVELPIGESRRDGELSPPVETSSEIEIDPKRGPPGDGVEPDTATAISLQQNESLGVTPTLQHGKGQQRSSESRKIDSARKDELRSRRKHAVRMFASEARMWPALTGHGPDPQRVKPLDFAILSLIAVRGYRGILQHEIVRQSGQDKRSVPHRTDRLQEDGYIIKEQVITLVRDGIYDRKLNTSLCTLKRYANAPEHQEELQRLAAETADKVYVNGNEKIARKKALAEKRKEEALKTRSADENKDSTDSREEPVPQWCAERPVANDVFRVVEATGTAGATLPDIRRTLFGDEFKKPIEFFTNRLVDAWQISQPLHLRHLAIVRDTVLRNKSPIYIHYTFSNYQKRVDAGHTSWEAVTTIAQDLELGPYISAALDCTTHLEDHGFPLLDYSTFVSHSDALLSRCAGYNKNKSVTSTKAPAYIPTARGQGLLPAVATISPEVGSRALPPPIAPVQRDRDPDNLQQQNAKHMIELIKWLPLNANKNPKNPRKFQSFKLPSDIYTWGLTQLDEYQKQWRRAEGYQFSKIDKEVERRARHGEANEDVSMHILSELEKAESNFDPHQVSPILGARIMHKYTSGPSPGPTQLDYIIARLRPKKSELQPQPNIGGRWGHANVTYLPSIAAHTFIIRNERRRSAAKAPAIGENGRKLQSRPSLPTNPGVLSNGDSIESNKFIPFHDFDQLVPGVHSQAFSQSTSPVIAMTEAKSPPRPSAEKRGRPKKLAPASVQSLAQTMQPSSDVQKRKISKVNPPSVGSRKRPRAGQRAFQYLPSIAAHSGSFLPVARAAVDRSLPPMGLFKLSKNISKSLPRSQIVPEKYVTMKEAMNRRYEEQYRSMNSLDSGVFASRTAKLKRRFDEPFGMPLVNLKLLVIRLEALKHTFSGYSPLLREGSIAVPGRQLLTFVEDSLAADNNALLGDIEPGDQIFHPGSSPVSTSVVDTYLPDTSNNAKQHLQAQGSTKRSQSPSETHNTENRPDLHIGWKQASKSSKSAEAQVSPLNANALLDKSPQTDIAKSPDEVSHHAGEPVHDARSAASVESSPRVVLRKTKTASSPAIQIGRISRGGGSTALLRKEIVMELVKKAGGVCPGHKELTLPFAEEWNKRGQPGQPEIATVRTTINALCAAGKLRPITFAYKTTEGLMKTKNMLTLPDVDPLDPRIKELQDKLIKAGARNYLPKVWLFGPGEDDGTVSANRVQRPIQPGTKSTDHYARLDHHRIQLQKRRRAEEISKIRQTKKVVTLSQMLHAKRARRRRSNLYDELMDGPTKEQLLRKRKNDRIIRIHRPKILPKGFRNIQMQGTFSNQTMQDPCTGSWNLKPPSLKRRRTTSEIFGPYRIPWRPIRSLEKKRRQQREELDGKNMPEPDQLRIARSPSPGDLSSDKSDSEDEDILTGPPGPGTHSSALIRSARAIAQDLDRPTSEDRILGAGQRSRRGSERFGTASRRQKPVANVRRRRGLYLGIIPSYMNPRQDFHAPSGTFSTSFNGLISVIISEERRRRISGAAAAYNNSMLLRRNHEDPTMERSIFSIAMKTRFEVEVDRLLVWELTVPNAAFFQYQKWTFLHHRYLDKHKSVVPYAAQMDDNIFYRFNEQANRLKPSNIVRNKYNAVSGSNKRSRDVAFAEQSDGTDLEDLTATGERKLLTSTGKRKVMKRRKRAHYQAQFSPEEEERFLTAMVAVRCVTGGIEKRCNWTLISAGFGQPKEISLLKLKWKYLQEKYGSEIQAADVKFQDAFMTAYENNVVPALDFANLEAYPWKWLVDWYLGSNTQPKIIQSLPSERSSLLVLTPAADTLDDHLASYYGLEGTPTIQARRNAYNRQAWTQPLILPPLRSIDETSELSVAATWVRANITSHASKYDSKLARLALAQFPTFLIEDALQLLLKEKIVVQNNKGRLAAGRSYSLHEGTLSKLQKTITVADLKRAAAFKRYLDTALMDHRPANGQDQAMVYNEEGKELNWSYHAQNAEALVLFNMLAHDRITMRARDVPKNAMGFLDGGYETRKLDKTRLYARPVILARATYVKGNPILPLPEPKGKPVLPLQNHVAEAGEVSEGHAAAGDRRERRIPLWYDIHGNLLCQLWETSLAAVLCIVHTRPGIKPEDVNRSLRPMLDTWEVELVLEWAVEAGVGSWGSGDLDLRGPWGEGRDGSAEGEAWGYEGDDAGRWIDKIRESKKASRNCYLKEWWWLVLGTGDETAEEFAKDGLWPAVS